MSPIKIYFQELEIARTTGVEAQKHLRERKFNSMEVNPNIVVEEDNHKPKMLRNLTYFDVIKY